MCFSQLLFTHYYHFRLVRYQLFINLLAFLCVWNIVGGFVPNEQKNSYGLRTKQTKQTKRQNLRT